MSRHQNLIAFDATPLEVTAPTGVSRYTAELLAALARRDDGWKYVLLASKKVNGFAATKTARQAGVTFPNRSVWIHGILPVVLATLRPALCHFTNSIAPMGVSCPFVLTLHDMSLFLHSQTQPIKNLLAMRTMMPSAARRAAAIVAPSASARADIVRVLNVPVEKVHVIYHGANPKYHVIDDETELDRVRRKYGVDAPCVLYVGTLEPRKNLERLVRAFAQVRRNRVAELVLAGRAGWKYGPLMQEIERSAFRDSIRMIGYVPEEDLPALYNLARVVALPSLDEGFGLPLIEGMASGVPILTSNRSAMAEIAGDAAELVDPFDETAIADGLVRALADEARRAELRAAGLRRARLFSWDRTAEETVRVYQSIISNR
jgi:glycosyltransferase involved in cell wall biosynthesis